ncbi:MAG: GlsB/YeaQ/YmgE family stress response membrane protein [Alphaproteobacteria bacterium]|nr:GlsB/YeaQ/YmgE family stress response membrane protein [Alphaproteobacteria bacterium]MDE2073540.1 GlsB/YeaQ/YmgE family stress response membrane protein [Alphaproteobacteria bacterium]
MSVLGWIVFGLIVGWIANKVVGGQGQGCFLDIALGIVGALVGGALFNALGTHVFMHFSLASMFVAVLGAVIVLAVYHAVAGRR